MKKFNLKGVIDNIRQSVNTPSPPGLSLGPVKLEQDLAENLVPEQFTVEDTVRHGFPFKSTAMAFDPVQKLLAIGSRYGSVRIFGRPGIDLELIHESGEAILQIEFIINEGKLLTACTDNSVNLWDFSQKEPELIQSIKLNKEKLTVLSVEFQDKWLYLGTERGNTHIMNLETFCLSAYVIAWNKCIDPLMKNHPGSVSHISLNPADNSKLLIGFESGMICLWDLTSKKGEQRYNYNHRLCSTSWHMEGRQFACSYTDGSLVIWNVKPQGNKPQSVTFPHGKLNKETKKYGACDPIEKVVWRVNRTSGENYFVFTGGLPADVTGVTPSITIQQGINNKDQTLMEIDNTVVDFLLVTDSPYSSDYQEPQAVIVMLANDLVAIDCKGAGLPCFNNPYAMDLNESPVTCCKYFVDCPGDLIPTLYLMGSKVKEVSGRNFSSGEWPVSGGIDSGSELCSYQEMLVTGHADGTIRFWDCSSTAMQSLYKVKTIKYFEKDKSNKGIEDDPYAITQIDMCGEKKEFAIAGATGQVIYFKLRKKETVTETMQMEIPIVYEVTNHPPKMSTEGNQSSPPNQQHFEFPTPKPLLNVASQSASYADPVDGFNFDKPQYEYFSPLKFRVGSQRKAAGFHATLVCVTPWVNNEPPTPISCLAINTAFGLVAYGNGSGLVVVDTEANTCLLNMGTADLYGQNDPFHRMPKSPKPLDASVSLDIVRVDLSSYCQIGEGPSTPSLAPSRAIEKVKSPDCRRLQKANSSAEEGGISKSHSSSANSLDQVITHEGVTALKFVDSFTTKNDYNLGACLYVGTGLGSVIAVVVNMPESEEARVKEPVVVSPSGSIYRIRGSVLTLCFLDASSGSLSVRGNPPENVHVTAKAGSPHALVTQGSQEEKVAPPGGDQQIAVVCTEKTAAVYALPSQRQMYSQTINESSNVVRAEIVNFGGVNYNPVLVAYTADGFLKAYSLPSLRPMLDTYFTAKTPRVERTLAFGHYGHALYFCNQNELQKVTISSDFFRQLPDMKGSTFQENIPMPEPPKQGFLKGLFGGGPKPLDRDELFGEKSSASTATHIPGATMSALQAKGGKATNEVSKAKMAFVERGEKLNELEERTEAMANEAKNYASNAHILMLANKNKKWYNFN